MRLDVSMEERFPVGLERVWQALTDPRMIERWLMSPAGFDAKPGTRFTLAEAPGAGCGGPIECEVLELSPPHRMVWSWRGADEPATTRLVVELEADGPGTRLRLRHTGEADEPTVRSKTDGWTEKLKALAALLTSTEEADGND